MTKIEYRVRVHRENRIGGLVFYFPFTIAISHHTTENKKTEYQYKRKGCVVEKVVRSKHGSLCCSP